MLIYKQAENKGNAQNLPTENFRFPSLSVRLNLTMGSSPKMAKTEFRYHQPIFLYSVRTDSNINPLRRSHENQISVLRQIITLKIKKFNLSNNLNSQMYSPKGSNSTVLIINSSQVYKDKYTQTTGQLQANQSLCSCLPTVTQCDDGRRGDNLYFLFTLGIMCKQNIKLILLINCL